MKRIRILLALSFIVSFTGATFAQDILMTIGDKEITLDEFRRIYNKNNTSLVSQQQTPEEYLDMFINFKLKVIEAESRGMDTIQKFLDEFNGYKKQLAAPYLTDNETKEELMREAYQRMLKDVHVSHILLKMNQGATPEDTLARYNKAMEIRQRILDGEDFETVAKATSDDPSARYNGGDLGFFTVFMMVYPFETAAYKLGDGDISMPVRSNHGYHILKKHGSRDAVGQVRIAHIFIRTPEGMPSEELIKAKHLAKSIEDSLNMGADFATMAKRYSHDQNSAPNGGELRWFGTGRMLPDFEKQVFKLKYPGDLTPAFQTFYGWHIAVLYEKKEIKSYEEEIETLEARALKGDRDRVKRKRYLDTIKARYNYELNQDLYDELYEIADSSLWSAKWKPVRRSDLYDNTLFSLTNQEVKVSDFLKYMEKNQRNRAPINVNLLVDINFNKYIEEFMLDVEKASLPGRFPEYKYILQEYHDGILLFDLMDQEVWSKAVKDTLGLETFFNQNRSKYMWGERMQATIVSCDSAVDADKVYKKAIKIFEGKWDEAKFNKKYGNDKVQAIVFEDALVEEGVNEHIDELKKIPGIGKIYKYNMSSKFVILNSIEAPCEKELSETRGQVTSDYQDYLEKEWIESLRSKYEVSVNKEVLSKVEN